MLNSNPKYHLLNSNLLVVLTNTVLDYSFYDRIYDFRNDEKGILIELSDQDTMQKFDRIFQLLDMLYDCNHPKPSEQKEVVEKIEKLLDNYEKYGSGVSINL